MLTKMTPSQEYSQARRLDISASVKNAMLMRHGVYFEGF
jgi:hypothetical protein